MSEISERLVAKLKTMANDFFQPDLDEAQLLYSYCSDEFPESFRKIFESFQYTQVRDKKANWVTRLLRILEIEISIPKSAKRLKIPDKQEVEALVPTFSVDEQDAERIFELCSEMRKIVLASTDFDQPHKVGLLNRIAAIESQTQKPKGLFDVVRGGINDLGETLGKFGKEIKPLTDRMNEVVSIARKGSEQYKQLPEPVEIKQLPSPEEDDNAE